MIQFIEIENLEIIENNNGIYVNDLTVSNNHTYLANNFIVHNCTTSPNTGVHYPIASLIDECRKIKDKCKMNIKIIADGGIRNYGDVIKALALGADYVMVGSLFASFYESAAYFNGKKSESNYCNVWVNSLKSTINIDIYNVEEYPKKDYIEDIKRTVISNYCMQKQFYGMSTKTAQKLINPNSTNLKTSEGTEKKIKVNFTINQWTENMEAYLRSAMSYCNSKRLIDFIGKQKLIINSISEINSVNK